MASSRIWSLISPDVPAVVVAGAVVVASVPAGGASVVVAPVVLAIAVDVVAGASVVAVALDGAAESSSSLHAVSTRTRVIATAVHLVYAPRVVPIGPLLHASQNALLANVVTDG
jgi:hypothetical protein